MKNTIKTFQQMKDRGEKISMLTAYDYSTAKLEDNDRYQRHPGWRLSRQRCTWLP